MASTREWFESVEEARRLAERRLPRSVASAIHAGAERGTTLEQNVSAFAELGLLPRVATGSEAADLSTRILGQPLSMPVMISPTGVQAVHPDGEVAVARAASSAGTAMGLASFASRPVEEVAAECEPVFFQTYWMGSRGDMESTLARARAAGAKGLIVTLDWIFAHRRDHGSPAIPERLDLRNMARLSPEALRKPRWLARYLHARKLPDLSVPNVHGPPGETPTFFGAYGSWMSTGQPTWEEIGWLKQEWGGPLMVKGVLHPDDARSAVAIGADAVSVSNHGGNNLDSSPASIRLLPAVAEAVGDEAQVLLDGGIRRGADVVKAIALGADAVMIGRPYLWGLAARGQLGVENVLEILRAGIAETLLGLGVSSTSDLRPGHVLVPEGFRIDPG